MHAYMSHCINNMVSMATRKHKSFYTRHPPTHQVALPGRAKCESFASTASSVSMVTYQRFQHRHHTATQWNSKLVSRLFSHIILSYGFVILCKAKSFHLILNDAVTEHTLRLSLIGKPYLFTPVLWMHFSTNGKYFFTVLYLFRE